MKKSVTTLCLLTLSSIYAGDFDESQSTAIAKTMQELIQKGEYGKTVKEFAQYLDVTPEEHRTADALLNGADAMLAQADKSRYRLAWRHLSTGLRLQKKADGTPMLPPLERDLVKDKLLLIELAGEISEQGAGHPYSATHLVKDRVLKIRYVGDVPDDRGKSILEIVHVKGLGDSYMFAGGYAPSIKELVGCPIVMRVPFEGLKSSFERCEGITKAITDQERAVFVEQCSNEGRGIVSIYTFDLPLVFSRLGRGPTDIKTIPSVDRPVISPLPSAVQRVAQLLAQDSARVKVGICWQAGTEMSLARPFNRSFPLNEMVKKLQSWIKDECKEEVSFYSLQGREHRPVTLEELQCIKDAHARGETIPKNDAELDENDVVEDADLIKQVTDVEGAFEGTIAFANADTYVITVDTSTLHVVGRCLPRTRFVDRCEFDRNFYALLPAKGHKDWRFEAPKATWYKNMKLFEQESPGVWDDAINRVAYQIGVDAGLLVDFN